jgi:serine/threonine-protein kinase
MLPVVEGTEPLIGRTIAGRYRITRKLGHGGMGAVFEALQEPLGRTVAVKVLKSSYARDEIAVARFRKEAAIVAALSHPNIVTLHDYGETEDGLLYIVMEHLKGSTLTRIVRSEGAMPWQRTLPIVQDITRALAAAHAVGVIHRDLKLDNVMLVQADDDRDHVKILDFGIAKTLHGESEGVQLTQTDSSPGTPGYMSPELARGVTDDPRSDFYALGVVWFELLVGRRPFVEKNMMDVFLAQMTRPTPSVREAAPEREIPDAIDALLQRLLHRSPEGRPANTTELLDALAGVEANGRPRRTTSGSTARASVAPSSSETSTVPTAAGLFLPTQFGPPPAMTDASPDAPTVAATVVDAPLVPTVPDVAAPPPAPAAEAPRRKRSRLAAVIQPAILVAGGVGAALFALNQGAAPRHVDVDVAPAPPPSFTIEVKKPLARPKIGPPSMRGAASDVPQATETAPAAPVDEPDQPQEEVRHEEKPVDVEGATAAPAEAALHDVDTLRARLASVGDRIRERMLLPDDVPGYRALSARVSEDLAAGKGDDAAAALDQLEANVSAVRFTDDFIRKKILRIEGGLPKQPPDDAAVAAELANLRTDVHEHFGAHDLPATNLALNRLWLFSLKHRLTR